MAGEVGSQRRPIAAINMTPLVDIMLVLLIIFLLVTQAVDSASVPVKLPVASKAQSSAPQAVLVGLDLTGNLRVDGRAFDRPGLRRFLSSRTRTDTTLQVVLAADERLPYARVMEILDDVRGAGVRRYALKVRSGIGPLSALGNRPLSALGNQTVNAGWQRVAMEIPLVLRLSKGRRDRAPWTGCATAFSTALRDGSMAPPQDERRQAMMRRRPSRVRGIPAWDLISEMPEVVMLPTPSESASGNRMAHPAWLAAVVLLVLAGWWFARLPASTTVEITGSKAVSDIQSVEISPTPPQPQVSQEIQEAVPTNVVPTTQTPIPSSPSVGLVDAGAQGGSGNGLPGLDLGLEGEGAGMAVAAGGGGTGHGVGTGTGNGVGSQRMIYQLGQVDQDAATDRIQDPPYPRRAKEDGVEAVLELRILVDERGRVESIEVMGAPPGYGFEAALESASRQWRFRPAQLGGVPVPEWVRMPYSFHLN